MLVSVATTSTTSILCCGATVWMRRQVRIARSIGELHKVEAGRKKWKKWNVRSEWLHVGIRRVHTRLDIRINTNKIWGADGAQDIEPTGLCALHISTCLIPCFAPKHRPYTGNLNPSPTSGLRFFLCQSLELPATSNMWNFNPNRIPYYQDSFFWRARFELT